MDRIVIRPRVQTPLLIVGFTLWGLLGVTYFTSGDVVAEREWFGVGCGVMLIASGAVGVWRAIRLGVVVSAEGVRVRSFDSRDQLIPWSGVESVDCAQIGARAGLPLFAPVILNRDGEPLAIPALGTYSRADAERKAEKLRAHLSRQLAD